MALSFQKIDRTTPVAVAIPSTATTTVTSYTVATDEQVFLIGRVMFGIFSGSPNHLTSGGFLTCQAAVKNNAGTLSFITGLSGSNSNNPCASNTSGFSDAVIQAIDAGIIGSSTMSVTFAISGTSVNLNVITNGITACDGMGYIEVPFVTGYA
jgi:hypothetical protein